MASGNEYWNRIKDKIEYRLINMDRNMELLQSIPYRCCLDLAIVYHFVIHGADEQIMTATVTNKLLDKWDITEEDLYEAAFMNTPQLSPPMCESMTRFLLGMLNEEDPVKKELVKEENQVPLKVLTNQSMINGAATLLYPGVLRDISDWIGGDLVILPSSVHEVLLVKYDESMPLEELSAMVVDINQNEVPEKDILSDHVYLYRRKTDEIEIPCLYEEVY